MPHREDPSSPARRAMVAQARRTRFVSTVAGALLASLGTASGGEPAEAQELVSGVLDDAVVDAVAELTAHVDPEPEVFTPVEAPAPVAKATGTSRFAHLLPPPPVPKGEVTRGKSTWYGDAFAGRRTANGEIFDPEKLTAAHRALPFGTRLRLTNPLNGRQVVVRVNDRGPFSNRRVLDVSQAAARALGFVRAGVAELEIERLD